jgi:hypothetical protein
MAEQGLPVVVTGPGAEHDLALFNPFGDDAIVDVTFLTDTGVQQPDDLQAVVVPRRSRITIPVQNEVLPAASPRRCASQAHRHERSPIFDGTVPDAGPTWGRCLARVRVAHDRGGSPTTTDSGIGTLALANFADVGTGRGTVLMVDGQTWSRNGPGALAGRHTDVTRVPIDTDCGRRDLGRHRRPACRSSPSSGVVVAVVRRPRLASTRGTAVAAAAGSCPSPTPTSTPARSSRCTTPGPTASRALRGDSSLDSPGKAKVFEVALDNAAGALVLTAPQPIVVGLTLLGDAGASISTAIPDPSYAG